MDPTGPSQPSLDTVYSTAGNPAEQTDREKQKASDQANSNTGSLIDARGHGDIPVPSSHNEGPTYTSLGYDTRSSVEDKTDIPFGESNTEAEQMRAPGEGDVYKAQFNKSGFGEQNDLASGLDAKKQEQAGRREEVQKERGSDVDVSDVLGQGRTAVVEGR